MVEKDEEYFVGNSPEEVEEYFVDTGISNEGKEKRSKLKSNLIKAGAVGIGVVGLAGAANAASVLYRDEQGVISPFLISETGQKVEVDPIFTASEAANITATDITNLGTLEEDLDNKLNQPSIYNLDTETLTLSVGQIHSFIRVGNSLFGGSRTGPPTITKIHDANNMVSGGTTVITLTGKTYCESVTYSETTKKIYFLLVNEILELDPDTMAYTIFPITMTDGTGGSGAITTDGTYFYVVSYVLHSRVAKFSFNGSAFINIGETTMVYVSLQVGFGHSAQYDKDSGYLFVCGAESPGWVAKVNVTDLTYTLIRLAGGNVTISDDIAVAPDYIYGVLEGPPQYKILKVKKSDMSYSYIDPGIAVSGYGCIYNPYDRCVYTVYNTNPGSYIKINDSTGEMRLFTAPVGIGGMNELQFSEYNMWFTTWTTPAKVIRMANPNERYVRILKADNSIGYSYNEGDVVADSFAGDGSGLTNIAVGNDGEIQYKNGAAFDSNVKLKYEEDTNSFTEGNLKYLIVGSKVGVFVYD